MERPRRPVAACQDPRQWPGYVGGGKNRVERGRPGIVSSRSITIGGSAGRDTHDSACLNGTGAKVVDVSPDSLPLERLAPRRVLVDEVVDAVRNLLMDQTIRPGQSLIIGRLAAGLGVSHTPVREALASLESEGLVVKRPQRGYFATELLTNEEVRELFELRLLLEPWAAARVATASPDVDISGLRAELDDFGSALTSGPTPSYRLLCDHDIRFHGLLMRMCGNRHVAQAFARTNCHVHLLRLQTRASKAGVTLQEHEAIVSAIERRDANAAAEAMRTHLTEACDRAITLREHGEGTR